MAADDRVQLQSVLAAQPAAGWPEFKAWYAQAADMNDAHQSTLMPR
jgi:hypothetical protein